MFVVLEMWCLQLQELGVCSCRNGVFVVVGMGCLYEWGVYSCRKGVFVVVGMG